MNKLIYQKKYTYTVMNRTCFDEIAPWCVLDIFQDVASEHVEEYNLGFDGMLSKGLIWVLVRTKYQVINDPKPSNKELYVTTWQSEQARAEFTRDYIIKDKDGNILIKGSSKWCLIDINTRRIAPTKSLGIDITHNEFLFSEAFGKLNFDSLKENDTVYKAKVNFSMLDHNGHLNNAKYSEIIMNAIKLNKSKKVSSFEINYLKETFLDETLDLKINMVDNIIYVEGYKEENISFKAKICLDERN